MTSASRIAVIGSANTDLVTFVGPIPRTGETLYIGQNFHLGFGGKGANQAVAARLCGAEVMMVAKVGNDLFGKGMLQNFHSFDINTNHVRVVGDTPSGVASILVEASGQNRIIVIKGANGQLMPEDIDAAAAELRRMHIIILQFEVPLETVYHAVRFCREHNIRCIVNPAPAIATDLARLIQADYFTPN